MSLFRPSCLQDAPPAVVTPQDAPVTAPVPAAPAPGTKAPPAGRAWVRLDDTTGHALALLVLVAQVLDGEPQPAATCGTLVERLPLAAVDHGTMPDRRGAGHVDQARDRTSGVRCRHVEADHPSGEGTGAVGHPRGRAHGAPAAPGHPGGVRLGRCLRRLPGRRTVDAPDQHKRARHPGASHPPYRGFCGRRLHV